MKKTLSFFTLMFFISSMHANAAPNMMKISIPIPIPIPIPIQEKTSEGLFSPSYIKGRSCVFSCKESIGSQQKLLYPINVKTPYTIPVK